MSVTRCPSGSVTVRRNRKSATIWWTYEPTRRVATFHYDAQLTGQSKVYSQGDVNEAAAAGTAAILAYGDIA